LKFDSIALVHLKGWAKADVAASSKTQMVDVLSCSRILMLGVLSKPFALLGERT